MSAEVYVERGRSFGFRRADVEQSVAILEVCGADPADVFDLTMDLARFVSVDLPTAAKAIGGNRLRYLGVPTLDAIRPVVAGYADAYSRTFHGQMAIAEAIAERGES